MPKPGKPALKNILKYSKKHINHVKKRAARLTVRKWRDNNQLREQSGLPPLPHPKDVVKPKKSSKVEKIVYQKPAPKKRANKKAGQKKKDDNNKKENKGEETKKGGQLVVSTLKVKTKSTRCLGEFRRRVKTVLIQCNPNLMIRNILRTKFPQLEKARILEHPSQVGGHFNTNEDIKRAVQLGTVWLWPDEPLTAVYCKHSGLVDGVCFHFRDRKTVFTCALQDYFQSHLVSVRNRPHMLGLVLHIHSGFEVDKVLKKGKLKSFSIFDTECQVNKQLIRGEPVKKRR